MAGRTVIISDTHLGGPRRTISADGLRPLWAGAEELVVNGDAAELLHPRFRERAAQQIIRLTELCQGDGVRLTMLSGNHDPDQDYIRYLELAGGKVLVTHGDVLHPAISPWSLTAGRVQAAFHDALGRLPAEQRTRLEGLLEASRHAAYLHWDGFKPPPTFRRIYFSPWQILRLAHYWLIAPRLAAELAAKHRPGARFVVFGHTHRHGVWRVGGRVVINTGSFAFPGRPRAVVIEAGRLSVWPIRRRGSEHRLAPRPLEEFDLTAGDAPPR